MLFVAVNCVKFILKCVSMNSTNYVDYVRQRYRLDTLNEVWLWSKTLLRLRKVKLDITSLKKCKHERLLPKFIRFKILSTHSRFNGLITDYYWKILLKEIQLKKQCLNKMYRTSHDIELSLKKELLEIHFARIRSILNELVEHTAGTGFYCHENKLNILRDEISADTTHNIPAIDPIVYLSKKVLTENEKKTLVNGLDYVLSIGLMQKYPPILKKMFLNDVALLWMRGFHAYDTASVS